MEFSTIILLVVIVLMVIETAIAMKVRNEMQAFMSLDKRMWDLQKEFNDRTLLVLDRVGTTKQVIEEVLNNARDDFR